MLTKTTYIRYPDVALKASVEEELKWARDLDAAGIGVSVSGGVVTLTGEVSSFAERVAAYKAAMRVHGVTAIADDVVVRGTVDAGVSDTELAKRVHAVLSWTSAFGQGPIAAVVSNGIVTLTGVADWEYQRQAAERAVRNLARVREVHNQIILTHRASSAETARQIKEALVRNAALDAESISVVAHGTTVTISGTVRSLDEKREAARAAWKSPNVDEVVNRLDVQPI